MHREAGTPWTASYLTSDRNTQIVCQRADESCNQVPILHEEGTVMASSGNSLWTTQVDIYCVTLALYKSCSRQQVSRIISAELHQQGPAANTPRGLLS